MARIAAVAGVWFLLWIVAGAFLTYELAGEHGGKENAVYFGAIYGAFGAAVTAFAWPWILPGFIHDWMDGKR